MWQIEITFKQKVIILCKHQDNVSIITNPTTFIITAEETLHFLAKTAILFFVYHYNGSEFEENLYYTKYLTQHGYLIVLIPAERTTNFNKDESTQKRNVWFNCVKLSIGPIHFY